MSRVRSSLCGSVIVYEMGGAAFLHDHFKSVPAGTSAKSPTARGRRGAICRPPPHTPHPGARSPVHTSELEIIRGHRRGGPCGMWAVGAVQNRLSYHLTV